MDIRLETVDIPRIGPGELLVRVKAATTCGTDLKTYIRGYRFPPPFILGHEWAGDIVEVSEGESRFEPGMKVSGVNSAPCFTCYYCKAGQHNLCPHIFKDIPGFLGTYAEYVRIPPQIVKVNVFEIPEGVPYENVALTEPLACCLNGIEEVNVRLGDSVTIIGSGPIGLFHLQLALMRGARKVFVIDPVEKRLKVASELGANETINPKEEDPVERVKALTDGVGSDVVVEAAGFPETWEQAIRIARKGGRVNLFAGPPLGSKITVDTQTMHYGSLQLFATFHLTPSTAKRSFEMIASGKIDVDPIITHRMPLADTEKAFALMKDG